MFASPLARMEEKPARLTVLIDAEKKKAFEELCAAQDITASQVVRQLIREYLARSTPALRNSGIPADAPGANR